MTSLLRNRARTDSPHTLYVHYIKFKFELQIEEKREARNNGPIRNQIYVDAIMISVT